LSNCPLGKNLLPYYPFHCWAFPVHHPFHCWSMLLSPWAIPYGGGPCCAEWCPLPHHPFHCWTTVPYVTDYQECYSYEGIRRPGPRVLSPCRSPVSLVDVRKRRLFPSRVILGLGLCYVQNGLFWSRK